jgi:hypothetical protein
MVGNLAITGMLFLISSDGIQGQSPVVVNDQVWGRPAKLQHHTRNNDSVVFKTLLIQSASQRFLDKMLP